MRIESCNINFGIYKGTKTTGYGHCVFGLYKNKNIEIYNDTKKNIKLYYVSDKIKNWIKSKLVYFDNGKKKTIISENEGYKT